MATKSRLVERVENLARKGKLTEIEDLLEDLKWQDKMAYALACIELDRAEPEDLDYEQGKAELDRIGYFESQRKEKTEPDYEGFVREIWLHDINVMRCASHTDEKKRILRKYFPRKFDPEKGIDLSRMADGKLGRLFENLYLYAKKSAGFAP